MAIDEDKVRAFYLSAVWNIDRRLWTRSLLRAFDRNSKAFQRAVDNHDYDGAALILTGKLWQGVISWPLGAIGSMLLGLGFQRPVLRPYSYVLLAGAISSLAIALVHSFQGARRRLD